MALLPPRIMRISAWGGGVLRPPTRTARSPPHLRTDIHDIIYIFSTVNTSFALRLFHLNTRKRSQISSMDSKQGRFNQGLQVISTAEWPRRVNRSELQTEKDLRPVRNFETCQKFLSITDIDSRKKVDLNMTRSYTVQ